MAKPDKPIYKNPIHPLTNKPYWLPIVARDKSHLIGHLNGMNMIMAFIKENMEEDVGDFRMDIFLDSSRFTDIIDEKGTHALKMSKDEIEKSKNENKPENERENGGNILEPKYLELTCTCGNYYTFTDPAEVPEKNLVCDLCGCIIIQYTGFYDYEFLNSYE